jgi:hypothetical protein
MGKIGDEDFKVLVGRVILVGAVAYCGLLTIALVVSSVFKVSLDQPVRDLLLIILTWFTTKAGTVVDHSYGDSYGSGVKTSFMMQELDEKNKKEDTPCEDPPVIPPPST